MYNDPSGVAGAEDGTRTSVYSVDGPHAAVGNLEGCRVHHGSDVDSRFVRGICRRDLTARCLDGKAHQHFSAVVSLLQAILEENAADPEVRQTLYLCGWQLPVCSGWISSSIPWGSWEEESPAPKDSS